MAGVGGVGGRVDRGLGLERTGTAVHVWSEGLVGMQALGSSKAACASQTLKILAFLHWADRSTRGLSTGVTDRVDSCPAGTCLPPPAHPADKTSGGLPSWVIICLLPGGVSPNGLIVCRDSSQQWG